MNELVLELPEIDPIDFFGNQNVNLNLLKKHFPKLKLVARGNKIKVYGDKVELGVFDTKLAR
ncbi:MAG: phosphate starvation-inducible protein PhoH, partial [Marinirhabdus sp.]